MKPTTIIEALHRGVWHELRRCTHKMDALSTAVHLLSLNYDAQYKDATPAVAVRLRLIPPSEDELEGNRR